MGNSWTGQTIFFIDFEGSRTSGILEYGVVELRGAEIIAAHTRLCRPIGRIRPEDKAVHGLDEIALRDQRPFSDEWEFFAGLRERGPLAAHYAGVENGLLKSVWPYPRNSPDFARPGERIAEWGPWIDSARLYAQLYPHLGTGQLATLLESCRLQARLDALAERFCPAGRRRYHAALYDALAGAVLLGALATEPTLASLTLLQLLALSTLDGDRRDTLQQSQLFPPE